MEIRAVGPLATEKDDQLHPNSLLQSKQRTVLPSDMDYSQEFIVILKREEWKNKKEHFCRF